MNLNVKAFVDKERLIWAAAYMLHHEKPGAYPYLMKSALLQFLREQISLFGTDRHTLMGEDWENDFKDELAKATAWVERRFPDEG